MDVVRWGIIGCGNVTEVKSGPALQNANGSRLVAVMRRDGVKAADYARRHGVEKWYDDADRLIADPDVNAIYVATLPDTHEFYAMKACAAEKPCYVEKPMARNAAEVRRMTEAFANARIPLFVAYYRRGLPRFVTAKALIDSGALGRLTSVAYSQAHNGSMVPSDPDLHPWRLTAEQAGAGLFLDLGSHALDLLDFLVGPLENVRGSAANNGGHYAVEDTVNVTFTTRDGCPGTGDWNFVSPESVDEYVISGSDAELRFSCFGNEPIRLKHSDGSTESFDLPNPTHIQQPLIQLMVSELRGVGSDKCPSTSASALRTQIVMDTALDSYYGGREDGFWNRAWPGR